MRSLNPTNCIGRTVHYRSDSPCLLLFSCCTVQIHPYPTQSHHCSLHPQHHPLLAKLTTESPWYRLEYNLKMFMTRAYLASGGGLPYDEGWLQESAGNQGLLCECKWVINHLRCSLAYILIFFHIGKVTYSMARRLFHLHFLPGHTYVFHDRPSSHVFLQTSWNWSQVLFYLRLLPHWEHLGDTV